MRIASFGFDLRDASFGNEKKCQDHVVVRCRSAMSFIAPCFGELRSCRSLGGNKRAVVQRKKPRLFASVQISDKRIKDKTRSPLPLYWSSIVIVNKFMKER